MKTLLPLLQLFFALWSVDGLLRGEIDDNDGDAAVRRERRHLVHRHRLLMEQKPAPTDAPAPTDGPVPAPTNGPALTDAPAPTNAPDPCARRRGLMEQKTTGLEPTDAPVD